MFRHRAALAAMIVILVPAFPLLAQQDERDGHIYITRPDGSQPKQLPDLPGYDMQGSPCWSADGQLLAFDAWKHGQGERGPNARIVVINADGSHPRILCDGAMPSFSPRANRIAFTRYAPNRGVWVMSTEGPDKELVLLDEQGWGAQWSPDGSQIGYASQGSSGSNLATFDLIEGVTTQLFEGQATYQNFFWNFAWSPDSRQIAFKGERSDGKQEVAIVDARGAKHGLITRYASRDVRPNLDWGHDGSRLLFVQLCPERENHLQIYWVDPKTKAPPQLLAGQDPNRNNNGISLSPDGTKLAISSHQPPKKAAK
jgi:Tol biopolymer transport system component